jgi:hypothetical protein
MSRRAFVVALLVPLCVTAAAVASVAYNRSGGREPIVLTEREVYVLQGNGDDTTATLFLNWHPRRVPEPGRFQRDRSLPRRAFVALELDGPAFRALPIERERERTSRLVVVDIDPDADTLARRYPNARTHLISAAVVRVPPEASYADAVVVSLEPQRLSVPREWAAQLPRYDPTPERVRQSFEVEIRYGRNVEPWITAIRR